MTFNKSKSQKYIELPDALKELQDKIQEFINVVSETPFVTIRMYTPERRIRPYDSNDYSGDYSGDYLNMSNYDDDSKYSLYSKYNANFKPPTPTLIYYDTIIIQLNNTWYSIEECDTDKNYLKIATEGSVDESVQTITNGNTTTVIKAPIVQISVDKVDSDRAVNMLIFAILKNLSDEKVFYIETTKGA